MLECVINISEGTRDDVIDTIGRGAGRALLDLHRDPHHNRSVLTLAGPDVEEAAFLTAVAAVDAIDLRVHQGAHPRLGAVDVVPFVPLPGTGTGMREAVAARDRFAARLASDCGVPCFLYGTEQSLPDVRRLAFAPLAPDTGPSEPHPTAGATCVGARPVLVAYNLWLENADLATARQIAAEIRGPAVRALGLLASGVQVSCNLTAPETVGPDAVYDMVAARASIARAELVGLLPAAVLSHIDRGRWPLLEVSMERTIEARLAEAGLDGEVR